MATNENLIPIPGRLHSVATEGHVAGADEIYDDTLGKLQSEINQTIEPLPDNVAYLGDDEGQAVIPGFDPQTDTLHKAAQVLTTAQKDQVAQNLNNRGTANGMGRIELKATDDFKSVVEAQTGGNTVFVIKYDYTLTGDVTVPANCVLEFDGGSLSGAYTLTGSNTKIQAAKVGIFEGLSFAGTWNVPYISSAWLKDGDTKDAIKKLIDLTDSSVNNTIIIEEGSYQVSVPQNTHSINGNAAFKLKSNTKFVVNGTISLVDSPYRATVIIDTDEKENITICGTGTIVGNKAECSAAGIDGEFGFGIYALGKNITVKGLTIIDCWGDAMQIGEDTDKYDQYVSSDVKVEGITAYGFRRNGISVINGNNIRIDSCTIYNVDLQGMAPQTGIDVEPLFNFQTITNITISNCIIHDCVCGIMLTSSTFKISNAKIENCNIYNIVPSGKTPTTVTRAVELLCATNCILCNNTITCSNEYAYPILVSSKRVIIENNTINSSAPDRDSIQCVINTTYDCDELYVRNNYVQGESTFIRPNTRMNIEGNYIECPSLVYYEAGYVATRNNISFNNNQINVTTLGLKYNYMSLSGNTINCTTVETDNVRHRITNNNISISGTSTPIYISEESIVSDNIINFNGVINIRTGVKFSNNTTLWSTFSVLGEGVLILNNTFIKSPTSATILFTLSADYVNIISNNVIATSGSADFYFVHVPAENNAAKNILVAFNLLPTRVTYISNVSNNNPSIITSVYNMHQGDNAGFTNLTGPSALPGGIPFSGTTRPTLTGDKVVIPFFDKSSGVNKPIWWNGTAWVDAQGNPV